MPKLNEYLGSIVSSFTNARVMSDIQTVKIAEQYAKHELLKHFSVPRMRLEDVEVTIPVALDELSQRTKTVFEPIDNTTFSSLIYKTLAKGLGLKSLTRESSVLLRSEIAKQTQELEQTLRITEDLTAVTNFSERISKYTLSLAREHKLVSPEAVKKLDLARLISEVDEMARHEVKVSGEQDVLDELSVIAESHLLREQPPENLIYIKLKISEDGMEWQSMEDSKGEVTSKLLPE